MCLVFPWHNRGATTFASAKVKNAIGRIGIFNIEFVVGWPGTLKFNFNNAANNMDFLFRVPSHWL